MMVVEWVMLGVGYMGEYSEVSGHQVNGSLLVGSGCLFLVLRSSSISKKPI